MAPNSLFAVLLRSPWWISAGVAAVTFGVARIFVPPAFAAFSTLPFVVIACLAAWRQLRAPSAQQVAATLERVRGMSWDDFSAALEDAFQRDGYVVSRIAGPQADFELRRGGRVSLVACKRWKVGRTGIEPLRELDAALRASEAQDCIYVAAGEVTANASAFAAKNNIRLLQDAELAKLLSRVR